MVGGLHRSLQITYNNLWSNVLWKAWLRHNTPMCSSSVVWVLYIPFYLFTYFLISCHDVWLFYWNVDVLCQINRICQLTFIYVFICIIIITYYICNVFSMMRRGGEKKANPIKIWSQKEKKMYTHNKIELSGGKKKILQLRSIII